MASFLAELRRRNVFRVGIAYLAIAWLFLQVADIVLSAFGPASWVMQALIVAFALGFPIALGIAWAFELTPDGVKQTDEVSPQQVIARRGGRKLDFAIIGVLSLTLVLVVVDQYIIEPASVPKMSTLAVLPLANLSGNPDEEYFADGMTEALITSLAKVSALRVISRTSVMRFKDTVRPLQEIAAELGVDAIIEGSAMRHGDRFRITAQLIDAATDQHMWAESYDRDFRDVLILQNEIAKTIAQEIRLVVTPEESSRLAKTTVVSPDGYDAYLKGMQHFYRLTPQDLETSLQYFELSLEQNPDSALAHSGIAAAWIGLQQMGFVQSSVATPKAEAASLRALELDSDLAQAHHWLGVVRSWSDWNWTAAEKEFERAIYLSPSNGDARASYSHLLAVLGRFDEALVQAELALRLDPFNGWFQGIYGVVLHMTRRYNEAIVVFQEALRISPKLPFAWLMLAGSYHFSERFDEAIEAEGSLLAALGDTDSQRLLMQTYSEYGYREATSWLADLLAKRSVASGTIGWWVAFRYSHAGQDDNAIEWLERAFDQRDPTMPYFLVPEFDNVRPDPRVRELMRQMDML